MVKILDWYHNLRKRIKLFILREYGDGFYKVVTYKRIPQKVTSVTIDEKTYPIQLKKCIGDKKGLPMLFYVYGNANALSFSENNVIDAEMLRNFVEAKVIKSALGGEKEKVLTVLVGVLAVALVGVAVYSIYMQNVLNSRIVELVANMTRTDVIIG